MKNTTDNKQIDITESNNSIDSLTSMNLDNSYDYLNEYYVDSFEYANSFDYILDDSIDNLITNSSSSKGCKVISSGDSIHIIHESGDEKHIKKKDYECASDKYNKKKNAKKSSTSKKSSKPAQSSIPSIPPLSSLPTYTHRTTTSSSNTTSSNSQKTSAGGCLKAIIFLFVLGPCILPIILGIIQGILEVLVDILNSL